MTFNLQESIQILERTPQVLDILLSGLPKQWIEENEGPGTWSAYDVVGHLILGEKTDWLTRVKIILSDSESKLFQPFNRFDHLRQNQPKLIAEMLKEFSRLREQNLIELNALGIKDEDLDLKGIHPEFGEVSLRQLIATWAVHDLGHLGQIARVMAKQYKEEVGPWISYLGILKM